jgi:hypothetical protein
LRRIKYNENKLISHYKNIKQNPKHLCFIFAKPI